MNHPAVRTNETLCRNMTRLLHHYDRLALDLLKRHVRVHENIHQTRLCFKRMRAILRLGRFGTGKETYRFFNVFFRDQSRALSDARDLTALIELLSEFIASARSKATKLFLRRLKSSLEKQRKLKLANLMSAGTITNVISSIQLVEIETTHWNVDDDLKVVFCAGAKRVYKRGRQFFVAAGKNCDNHTMHEWRKQVKYFWYQLLVLSPVWPGFMHAWAKEVQTLSQWLGKHHDLVLLENALVNHALTPEEKAVVKNLRTSIKKRKSRLENLALKLGAKIYAETPGSFYERLISYF